MNDEHAPAIVDVNAFAGQFEQLVIDALSQVFPAGATYSSEDVIHAAAASAQPYRYPQSRCAALCPSDVASQLHFIKKISE